MTRGSIDLSRLDAVMEQVSDVRERVGRPEYLLDCRDYPVAGIIALKGEVRALAEAVADLVDVLKDKLAELAAGKDGGR